jgi:hypothetical protein
MILGQILCPGLGLEGKVLGPGLGLESEVLVNITANQCLPQPVAVGTHLGVHTMWCARW